MMFVTGFVVGVTCTIIAGFALMIYNANKQAGRWMMEVFRAGEDAEAPSIALLLHAGFMRLSSAVESHGRE